MAFRITGLSPEPFRALFALSDEELAARGARRVVADGPGFPERIGLREAAVGETLLLVNFTHQPADNPFRAAHAIFVGERSHEAYDGTNVVPEVLRSRLISLRAFDGDDMMVDADVVDGKQLESAIGRMFASPGVAYLQAHFAKRGCYAARVERA